MAGANSHRAADPGSAQAAVAARILREVLLMVVLGVVELRRRNNLGRDGSVAGLLEFALKRIARGLGRCPLRVGVVVDPRSVLRADVVALPHPLRRIAAFPVYPE